LQASTQKKQQPPPQNQTLNKDSYKDVSKRLLTDSRYTSLPPEKKALVRGRLYDKYVAPFYKGLSPNARETFSKAGTQDVSKINTASDLGRGTNDFFTHLAVTTGKQGIKLERGMDAAASRLGDVIYGVLESTGKGSLAAQAGDKFKTWMDRETQAGQKYYDKKEDEANSYLGQKFADNLTYKIAEAPIKVAGSAVADAASHPEWFIAGEGLSSLADGLLGKGALTEALNTGTTAQKMGYRAIKGAADGLVMGAYEGERGEDLAFTGAVFGELEAAGPLAGDAAKLMKPTAEKSIDFLSKLLVWGGPKRVGQALNAATSMTKEQIEALPKGKLSTQIIRATDKVLDNVAIHLGNYTRDAQGNLARDAKGRFVSSKQLASGVGALVQQANKEAAVHNPELVAAQVSKEVREAGQHPVGAEIQQYLKTQGIDLVKENTTKTVKNAAINAGIYKGIKTKINKEAASTVTKMLEGIGPGAASKTEKDVFKSLLGIVESHIPFESKDHTITQLWGMRKELPREVHPALIEAMKIIWGPSIKKWDAVAKRLETHMEKMEATGHITPSDMRGVFHSTKLSGQKTGWQKQLDDEFKAVSAAKKGAK